MQVSNEPVQAAFLSLQPNNDQISGNNGPLPTSNASPQHAYCQNCTVIRQINTNIKLAKQPAGIFLYLIPVHLRVIQQCLLSIVLLSAGLFLISCPESCIFPLPLMQHNYQKAQPKHVAHLIQLLNTIYPAGDALCEIMKGNMVTLTLKKDELLIAEGDTCHYMHFIVSGALMGFSTHKGKKIITYVSVENEFVSSISGMHGIKPSKEGIIAVEPTQVIALHNSIIQELLEKQFDFNYIFRVMVQKYYQDAQERAHIIRVGNGKERYLYFIETHPGFIDRLPLEHVASLLDMKPETLARIKKHHVQYMKKDGGTEAICKRLEDHLHQNKTYQIKDLKLPDLAEAIGITPHNLSSLLNNHYRLNFVDFINTYRINSIKEQMILPQHMQHFTIEAIAYEAGFSSRSAFYSAFKKITGTSPVEFSKSLV